MFEDLIGSIIDAMGGLGGSVADVASAAAPSLVDAFGGLGGSAAEAAGPAFDLAGMAGEAAPVASASLDSGATSMFNLNPASLEDANKAYLPGAIDSKGLSLTEGTTGGANTFAAQGASLPGPAPGAAPPPPTAWESVKNIPGRWWEGMQAAPGRLGDALAKNPVGSAAALGTLGLGAYNSMKTPTPPPSFNFGGAGNSGAARPPAALPPRGPGWSPVTRGGMNIRPSSGM